MHLQPIFDCGLAADSRGHVQTGKKRYKARVVGGEVAEALFNRGLCLPSGTAMPDEGLGRIIAIIRHCKKQSPLLHLPISGQTGFG